MNISDVSFRDLLNEYYAPHVAESHLRDMALYGRAFTASTPVEKSSTQKMLDSTDWAVMGIECLEKKTRIVHNYWRNLDDTIGVWSGQRRREEQEVAHREMQRRVFHLEAEILEQQRFLARQTISVPLISDEERQMFGRWAFI